MKEGPVGNAVISLNNYSELPTFTHVLIQLHFLHFKINCCTNVHALMVEVEIMKTKTHWFMCLLYFFYETLFWGCQLEDCYHSRLFTMPFSVAIQNNWEHIWFLTWSYTTSFELLLKGHKPLCVSRRFSSTSCFCEILFWGCLNLKICFLTAHWHGAVA